MPRPPIALLPSQQIDKARWDAVVSTHQGPIYCRTIYLDGIADNWSGIVMGDYQSVMPLPWRKKWGIAYLYTPPFMQQLGWVGDWVRFPNPLDLKGILSQHFRFGDYFFNAKNQPFLENEPGGTKLTNYLLPLSKPYPEIANGYANELKRHLRKNGHLTIGACGSKEAIRQYQQHYADRMPHVQPTDFERFRSLCTRLETLGMAFAIKTVGPTHATMATALFLSDGNRLYNLMPSTLPEHKRSNPMHFLMDQVIRSHAGKGSTMDFEGSELEGVARFYRSFGAIAETYSLVHINRLPWPLNGWKR